MKYIVVDLKAGNLFVNQNGVKNRVGCMAPTGKNKDKNKTTIGKPLSAFAIERTSLGEWLLFM